MGGEEGSGVTTGQPNLCKQELSKLDVNKLTALSPEVISRQATINIGTIGHVAHGKSTIVKAISTVHTVRFKNELERNITIKLDGCAAENGSGVIEEEVAYDSRSATPSDVDDKKETESFDEKSSECSSLDYRSNLEHIAQELIQQQDKELLRAQEKSKLESRLKLSQMQLKDVRIIVHDIIRYPCQGIKRQRSGSQKKAKKPKTNIYEVERILSKKTEYGRELFLVKWKDWEDIHNTWEPRENLTNCPEMLRIFENQNSKLIEKFEKVTGWTPSRRDLEEHMRNGDGMKMDISEVEDAISNYFRRKIVKRTESQQNKIRQYILSVKLLEARRQQSYNLTDWEKEMNNISKGKPLIRVENQVDLEMAPQDFMYIDEYLPGEGVQIPQEPPIGCECNDCGSPNNKDKCCFSQHSQQKMTYTLGNKIRVPPGTPIYECNKRCRCPPTCPNRVVQRGAYVKLCVFRTSNGTGWGVKTLRKIRRGSFVIQYVGEVITSEEAELRGKRYDAAGRTYLFDLDYNEGQCPYTVDAAVFGNVSHFINHSCEPNLAVYAVWIDCLDPNLPKLALFATRDIEQDEEITFDYMCQQEDEDKNNDTLDSSVMKDSRPRLEVSDATNSKNRTKCKCGSEMCRQYIF